MGFDLPAIYSCEGKHFKVYNSDLQEVLEHPNDEKPVLVNFSYGEDDLIITVKGFIKTKMRKENQKNRGDIYFLQKEFRPLLSRLNDLIERLEINSAQEKGWRFRSPQPRMGRQGVPKLVKLAEVSGVSLIAHFDLYTFQIKNGYLIIDSEIPGRDQTKWSSEGAERQIHFGIFGWDYSLKKKRVPKEVVVTIPLENLKNNFLKPIKNNWVN